MARVDAELEQPLLDTLHFNVQHRPAQDRPWAWAYLMVVVGTLVFGFASAFSRPGLLIAILKNEADSYLDDSAHCPLTVTQPSREQVSLGLRGKSAGSSSSQPAGASHDLQGSQEQATSAAAFMSASKLPRYLLSRGFDDDDIGALPHILVTYGGVLMLISLVGAALVAYAFVWALRKWPHAVVVAACVLQVGTPLLGAYASFSAGYSGTALVLTVLACVTAACFVLYQDSLVLVARILGLTANALAENPSLLALVALLKLALLLAAGCIAAAAAAAATAGQALPNPLRRGAARCATPAGEPVSCCVWAAAPTLPAFLPMATIALVWTVMLLFEVKVYAVAGVVAQWFWTPHGSPGPGLRGLRLSIRHALGPSFGSLCEASALLGVTSYLRAVFRAARHERGLHSLPAAVQPGHCCWCCCCCCVGCLRLLALPLSCCCSCLAVLLEQLTKFATVRMALSGDSFWRAGAETVALLRRNALDAYSLWWYLPATLTSTAVALSSLWGYCAALAARNAYWWLDPTGQHGDDEAPGALVCGVLGGLAGSLAWLTLSYICGVLLNIGDAMFICYALDCDTHCVTRYDVHAVYCCLPACGGSGGASQHGLVQQPDGTYGYGAAGAASAAAAPQYSAGHHQYWGPPLSAAAAGAPGLGTHGSHGSSSHHYQRSQQSGWRAFLGLGAPLGRSGGAPPGAGVYYGAGGGLPSLPPPPPPGQYGYGPQYPPVLQPHSGPLPVAASAGYRRDRPVYPPPAVLSPPYSDHSYGAHH